MECFEYFLLFFFFFYFRWFLQWYLHEHSISTFLGYWFWLKIVEIHIGPNEWKCLQTNSYPLASSSRIWTAVFCFCLQLFLLKFSSFSYILEFLEYLSIVFFPIGTWLTQTVWIFNIFLHWHTFTAIIGYTPHDTARKWVKGVAWGKLYSVWKWLPACWQWAQHRKGGGAEIMADETKSLFIIGTSFKGVDS